MFLFLGFLFGRVGVNTYAAWKTIKTIFLSTNENPLPIKIVASIIPALTGLNYYWFGLILTRLFTREKVADRS